MSTEFQNKLLRCFYIENLRALSAEEDEGGGEADGVRGPSSAIAGEGAEESAAALYRKQRMVAAAAAAAAAVEEEEDAAAAAAGMGTATASSSFSMMNLVREREGAAPIYSTN